MLAVFDRPLSCPRPTLALARRVRVYRTGSDARALATKLRPDGTPVVKALDPDIGPTWLVVAGRDATGTVTEYWSPTI